MKWLNDRRRRSMFVGFVAVIVLGGVSVKADSIFGESTNLGPPLNSSDRDAAGSMHADGPSLYFDSQRSGGFGGGELWAATRPTTEDAWDIPLASSQEEEYKFKLRKDRREGLHKIPRSGKGINLISFMAYRELLSLTSSSLLKIRFFLHKPNKVYINAVELQRHGASHYQMKPVKTSWDSGWREFNSWPASDVLLPLNISANKLGIVARLGSDRPGSGSIVPVMLYEHKIPAESTKYEVWLLPRNTLSKVEFSVVRVSDSKVIISPPPLRNLAGNAPFKIILKMKDQESGHYQLFLTSKELGRTKGPSRHFLFYHLQKTETK